MANYPSGHPGRRNVGHGADGTNANRYLPPLDTDRIRATLPAMAEKAGKSIEEMRTIQQAQIPAGRYGTPEEFGSICAFLCSQHAAYLTGQNVLADGGAYPGTY
jgi:3-oxoacyl-[acyl-carrier protein] reductase